MCKLRFCVIALIIKGDVRLFGYRSVFFHKLTEKEETFADITGERNQSDMNCLHVAHQFINTSICLSLFSFSSLMAMSYGNGISHCWGKSSNALVQIPAEKLSEREKVRWRTDWLR